MTQHLVVPESQEVLKKYPIPTVMGQVGWYSHLAKSSVSQLEQWVQSGLGES